ncbi:MAG: DUF4003 domain-containing protein [Lachnospiraceae bacterium]|nr:DUF4003 domain-containing protein [Lachnospiraceae bacterium]
MRDSLLALCNSYIANRDLIEKHSISEDQEINAICAAQLTGCRINISGEKLEETKKIMHAGPKLLTEFRSDAYMAMLVGLASMEDPAKELDQVARIFDILKTKFPPSSYLVLGSMILNQLSKRENIKERMLKAKDYYFEMHIDHPYLTNAEDHIMAMLLTYSDKEKVQIFSDTEAGYGQLRIRIKGVNNECVQSASQVLALGSDPVGDADRVARILELLWKAGRKYGKNHELGLLAVLALSDRREQDIVSDIIEVDDFLEQQKGYSLLDHDRTSRLLHAAMLTCADLTTPLGVKAGEQSGGISAMLTTQFVMTGFIFRLF